MDENPNEGGWRPTNLLEGVNRQFAWADHRVRTASIIGGSWGALLIVIGAYQFLGGLGVAPIEWNLVGGVAAVLFALGATSRNLLATAMLGLLCIGEAPALALSLGDVFAEGDILDQGFAGIRVAMLPAVLYYGVQGYAGAYEYQRLRRPHSARSWRAINPAMLQGAIYSSLGVLVIGFMFGWSTNIMEGFATPGAPVMRDDGSVDTSSRLSKHMQDNAVNIAPFQQQSEKEQREEEERRAQARKEAEEEHARRMSEETEAKLAPGGADGAAAGDAEGGEAGAGGVYTRKPPRIDLKGPAYVAAQEAMQYGAKTDNVGCLTESLRRHESCKDEECRNSAGVFVTACLPESKPVQGFCNGVPSVLSPVETTAWRARLCATGATQACHAFYANLQAFCHPKDADRAKAAANAKK